jgi:hypothetical protein
MRLHSVTILTPPGEPLSCDPPYTHVVAITLGCPHCGCIRMVQKNAASYLEDRPKIDTIECAFCAAEAKG